jgi:hypothetical protein
MASMEEEMTSRMRGETQGAVGRFSRRWPLALLAFAFVIAFLAIAPTSASAVSRYRVIECYPGLQVHSAADVNAWGYDGSVIQYGVTCTSPNGHGWNKGIALHPSASDGGPRAATAEFVAPAGTYFDSGSFRWEVGARYPCALTSCWYSAAYAGSGSTPVLTYPMHGAPSAGVASIVNCGSACTRVWEDLVCESACIHFASDPGGNANDWYYDYVAIRDLDLILVDTKTPTLALSGSLFDGQIAHGTPTLQIKATDIGGGVRSATVEVNGVTVAAPATNCPGVVAGAAYATQFHPCGNLAAAVPLDTERTPWRNGQNTLRVCVADVATGPGAPNTVCEPRAIFVDNSCPDSSGASGKADSIVAGLENPKTGQLQRMRAVRSNEGAALRGQLTGSAGPVKAASVCVYETVDDPAGIEQLVQVAKSSSTGQFGVQISGGPSRSFRVGYRYGAAQIGSVKMHLDSSVVPTLKLSDSSLPNGSSVGFHGRIPGPGNDGRAVTLQARVGKKWRSFKQLQTDPNGMFRGKYRFTQTHGRVLYTFRALVKKQGGYPYSPGASKKRRLVVRG